MAEPGDGEESAGSKRGGAAAPVATSPPKKRRRRRRDRLPQQAALDALNWYHLGDGLPPAAMTATLYNSVSITEFESVVGWATHVTSNTLSSSSSSSSSRMANNNPLVDLPSQPLPPDVLEILHDAAAEAVETSDEELEHLQAAYDQSALVSLGMCLEEMITATLLPLATAHMKRCQRLKRKDTMSELLLPPEECILKLVKERQDANMSETTTHTATATTLPTLAPPTHSAVDADEAAPQSTALAQWAEAHRLEASFLENNADIFGVFQQPQSTR